MDKNLISTKILSQKARLIAQNEGCPLEWFQSWPVPIFEKEQIWLIFLFFPCKGKPPSAPIIYPPRIKLKINLKGDKYIIEKMTLNIPIDQPLGTHDFSPPIDMDDFLSLEEKLWKYYDIIIMLISKKFPPNLTETERKIIIDFYKLKEKLFHKPLKSFYYNINPQFWDWIEKIAKSNND